ncbi:conserved hypothetical protein [Rhodococcus ruber]|uniref:Uncharacterized protein n=1 Tax=Rhodococcus ruber TaxID=1830 RepID=A0A098BM03_9NOCA|nr:conserved hypothetical protein [Rhodococcus ruber]
MRNRPPPGWTRSPPPVPSAAGRRPRRQRSPASPGTTGPPPGPGGVRSQRHLGRPGTADLRRSARPPLHPGSTGAQVHSRRPRLEGPSLGTHGEPGTAQSAPGRGRQPPVTVHRSLEPHVRSVPPAVGDHQGCTLAPGPSHHRPGPRRRHHDAPETENDEVHAVEQDGGHLHRIRPRVGDQRDPAQLGPHLGGSQQTQAAMADDGGMPTGGGGRGQHTEQQRRCSRKAYDGSTSQAAVREQPGERLGHREQPIGRHRRRGGFCRAGTGALPPRGDRGDLPTQRLEPFLPGRTHRILRPTLDPKLGHLAHTNSPRPAPAAYNTAHRQTAGKTRLFEHVFEQLQ